MLPVRKTGLIESGQMFPMILEACPSFAPMWEEFVAEWQDERNDPPLYLALGDLARHLIELYESGNSQNFPAIFQVVERWHTEGDPFVREAATVGLLEDLQNSATRSGIPLDAFHPWLLPDSKKWWDKLIRFWDGDIRALSEDVDG